VGGAAGLDPQEAGGIQPRTNWVKLIPCLLAAMLIGFLAGAGYNAWVNTYRVLDVRGVMDGE
jgi:hypothetical protein